MFFKVKYFNNNIFSGWQNSNAYVSSKKSETNNLIYISLSVKCQRGTPADIISENELICSYVCRRLRRFRGRNLADTPRSSAPLCCSDTWDILRCGGRSFPPRWGQCGHYSGRAGRAAARRHFLMGFHGNPPDTRHSEDLKGQTDTWLSDYDMILCCHFTLKCICSYLIIFATSV